MHDLQERFTEHGKQFTPEEIRAVEQQWAELLTEVQANRDQDPASPKAQELADRWNELIEATFKGNTELMQTVGENYQQGAYADFPNTPTPEDFAFIARANAAKKGRSAG